MTDSTPISLFALLHHLVDRAESAPDQSLEVYAMVLIKSLADQRLDDLRRIDTEHAFTLPSVDPFPDPDQEYEDWIVAQHRRSVDEKRWEREYKGGWGP